MVANAVVNIPRNYASIFNNVAPTTDFNCDAGVYGLTMNGTATGLQLQRLIVDPTLGAVYVNIGAALTVAGYAEYHLPAGQYHLALTGGAAVSALFERIGPWAGR